MWADFISPGQGKATVSTPPASPTRDYSVQFSPQELKSICSWVRSIRERGALDPVEYQKVALRVGVLCDVKYRPWVSTYTNLSSKGRIQQTGSLILLRLQRESDVKSFLTLLYLMVFGQKNQEYEIGKGATHPLLIAERFAREMMQESRPRRLRNVKERTFICIEEL